MTKKRLLSLFVVFILVSSIISIAQTEETADPCSGVFGWLGCMLFGSSEARAGKSWFDREEAVAGIAAELPQDVKGWSCTAGISGLSCVCESELGCYGPGSSYYPEGGRMQPSGINEQNFPAEPPSTQEQAKLAQGYETARQLAEKANKLRKEGNTQEAQQAEEDLKRVMGGVNQAAEEFNREVIAKEREKEAQAIAIVTELEKKIKDAEKKLQTAPDPAAADELERLRAAQRAAMENADDAGRRISEYESIARGESINMYGLYEQASKGNEGARADLERWASRGNAEAAASLGYLYETGEGGLQPDLRKAAELYSKACQMGDGVSCSNLGRLYQYGRAGLKKNSADALVLYKQACKLGFEIACNYQRGLEGSAGVTPESSGQPSPGANAPKIAKPTEPKKAPAAEPGRGALTAQQTQTALATLDELSKTNPLLALTGLSYLCSSGSAEACYQASDLSKKMFLYPGDAYDQAATAFARLGEEIDRKSASQPTQPAPAPSPPGIVPAPAPAPPERTNEQKMQLFLEEMNRRLSKAQQLLGPELYNHYLQTIILNDVGERTESNGDKVTTYPLAQGQGALTAVEDKRGYVTIYGEIMPPSPGPLNRWQVLKVGGVAIASQTNDQWLKNTLIVNGQPLKVAKGTDTTALKSGKAVPFYDEKNQKMGEAQATEGQVIVTNFREETQRIFNPQSGEFQELNGDYYAEGNQFLPSGGTWTTKTTTADGTVKAVNYVLDYDYKGSGDERKLSKVDVYDFQGNRVGAQFDTDGDNSPDRAYLQFGDTVIEKDTKTGEEINTYTKTRTGIWSDKNLLSLPNDVKNRVETAYTSSGMKGFQTVLESVYALPASIKSYPAISKLLFGETTAYKDWQSTMDKTFAPMLGSNWFPSAICESTERWRDDIPQGKAVIKTVSGTYQAVASIQMEKSEKKSPILCQKNPDEEADEQWICDLGQVCVDEQFCYADEDDEKPLQGYFYKITWAVTAPQDDALTLYVDENGVAVSFNIILNPGNIPLYNRAGNLVSPIMLQNGASDKDAIIKYSPKEYNEACIVWHQAPSTTNAFSGTTPIPNVCFTAINSNVGTVEWQQAGQSSARVSENKGEISRNTNW